MEARDWVKREKQLGLQYYKKWNMWHTTSGGRKTMMLKVF
jgi:hypothetical protein